MDETGRDELRLALVLNGGVSLAIWISGVVAEIDALRRCDEEPAPGGGEGDGDSTLPIYRALAEALGVRVRVDVIAGTSAGGLNGGLLGTAIAAGRPYGGVRELWLQLGDLAGLFNAWPGGSSPRPISVLKGEAVLYAKLVERFRPMLETAAADRVDPEECGRRVRMVLTGTDIAGVSHSTTDSFGDVLEITDHRLHARFGHGGDAGGIDAPAGWAELLPEDTAGRTAMADAVARAARTSASFPIGFEPSELILSAADSVDHATALAEALVTRGGRNVAEAMRAAERPAPLRRFAIDGGILDNSPIGAVLDTVTGLSAEHPVQRAVVFVVPYTDDPEKPPEPPPGFAEVLGTVLNMPRDVAFTDHLEEVERDLARRAGDRTAYDRLVGLPPDALRQLAGSLYPSFWRLRAVTSLWSLAQGYRSRLDDPPQAGVASPGLEVAGELDAIATRVDVQWLPAHDAAPDELWSEIVVTNGAWRWGGAPSERIALRIADWLMAAREALPLDAASPRDRLRTRQAAVHAAIRSYRAVERDRRRSEAAQVAAEGTLTLERLAAIASATWTAERRQVARDLLVTVASELAGAQGEPGLDDDVRGVLGIEPGASPAPVDELAPRLLMADVAWRGLRGALDDEHQSSNRYEFLRLNAASPPPFASRENGAPADKLFGMQLGHFAGFVRTSWRANDFMWGRLDGAARLVDLLLAPRRLQLSPVRYDTLAAIPGLRTPLPAKCGEYLDPGCDAELRAWRGCFQDTLALAIVEAELDGIASAMTSDVATRRFAPDPSLTAALGASDPRQRFLDYASALGGGDAATPKRTIKDRVLAEDDSFGGKLLEDQALRVVADVLQGQGGVLGFLGKPLHVFRAQNIKEIVREQRAVVRACKTLWARIRP